MSSESIFSGNVGFSVFFDENLRCRRLWHQKQRCVIELRKVLTSQRNATVVLLVMADTSLQTSDPLHLKTAKAH